MYKFQLPGANGDENAEIFVLDGVSSLVGDEAVNKDGVSDDVVTDAIPTIGAISEESSVSDASVVSDEEVSATEGVKAFKSGFENIDISNATLAEKAAYGGKVALIGMTTVFLVLIILWAICALMGKIFGSAAKQQAQAPKNDSQMPKPSSQTPANNVSATPNVPVATVDYSTVAVVASAAIAAFRGEDSVNFTVSSIRPCGNGAVALPPEVVAQIAASIACLEGKDEIDFTISSIRII